MTYAVHTDVPVARSRAEIESIVQKAGASHFASGTRRCPIWIMFEMHDRCVRFTLPLPQRDDPKFRRDGNGKPRSAQGIDKVHDQALRSRWRALLLVIKAKLEAVESVTTFEQEFLAHIILPGGDTVGDWAIPRIADAYSTGEPLPPMLGAGS